MQIEGTAAIVTGGASGLGGATAELLAKQGALVTVFDLNEAAGSAHAASIGGQFVKVDVTDEASVVNGLARAEAKYGVARILVNCAGVGTPAKTVGRDSQPHSLAAFRETVEINLIGTFNVLSRFAARLSQAGLVGEERGVIINTASVAAFDGQIGQAAYSASKAGLVGMTLPIARELAAHAIRVVTIAPGVFMTPLLSNLSQAALESLGRQVPFPSRLGYPMEFAQMVESILRIPMLNGETIRLDGAIRMAPR